MNKHDEDPLVPILGTLIVVIILIPIILIWFSFVAGLAWRVFRWIIL